MLEKSFGKERPLTEPQRQIRRNSAAFALITFNEDFGKKASLDRMHVSLTDEQIRFAKDFADVFPKSEDVLPISEFSSANQGYSDLVGTPMLEIIPLLLADQNHEFYGNYKDAGSFFREDPSGISYLQSLLNKAEEQARQGKNLDLKAKEEEVRAKLAGIVAAAEEIPELPKQEELSKDQPYDDALTETMLKIFKTKKSPQEEFFFKKRYKLHSEVPLEMMEDRSMSPTSGLIAMGARLAFEKYQTAVNTYMNRWGK